MPLFMCIRRWGRDSSRAHTRNASRTSFGFVDTKSRPGLRCRSPTGLSIRQSYRLDLLVDDCVIVEVKTVRELLPIHEAQLLSYLRLSHKRAGLLINFNEVHLSDGIKRLVSGYVKI